MYWDGVSGLGCCSWSNTFGAFLGRCPFVLEPGIDGLGLPVMMSGSLEHG